MTAIPGILFSFILLLRRIRKNIPVASVNILDCFIKLTTLVPLSSFTLAILASSPPSSLNKMKHGSFPVSL